MAKLEGVEEGPVVAPFCLWSLASAEAALLTTAARRPVCAPDSSEGTSDHATLAGHLPEFGTTYVWVRPPPPVGKCRECSQVI